MEQKTFLLMYRKSTPSYYVDTTNEVVKVVCDYVGFQKAFASEKVRLYNICTLTQL